MKTIEQLLEIAGIKDIDNAKGILREHSDHILHERYDFSVEFLKSVFLGKELWVKDENNKPTKITVKQITPGKREDIDYDIIFSVNESGKIVKPYKQKYVLDQISEPIKHFNRKIKIGWPDESPQTEDSFCITMIFR